MRELEQDKKFIPFEYHFSNYGLLESAGKSSQHVEYPEHCNIPTVIHINPLTHLVELRVYEVNDAKTMELTLIPIDGDR